MTRLIAGLVLAACGSTPAPTTSGPAGPTAAERAAAEARAERVRRDELGAAHRERLDEQATALAATCAKPTAAATKRCTPSCYAPAPPDPRAGVKVKGAVAIEHVVCGDAEGPYVIVDELGGAVRAHRGRVPRAAAKGTWQADVEAAVVAALGPEVARGDAVRVAGAWQTRVHPATKTRMRCTTVVHHTTLRKPLDACGSRGAIACEASENAAVVAVNLARLRIAEAQRLRDAGDDTRCQQAALEALAIARGLPRWRQYVQLNTDQWKPVARYRTRFDGVLDEDALFALATTLGTEAGALHTACGGAPNPTTTPAQEQAFHTCP